MKKPCSSLPRKILISGYHYETLFLLFEISFLVFMVGDRTYGAETGSVAAKFIPTGGKYHPKT